MPRGPHYDSGRRREIALPPIAPSTASSGSRLTAHALNALERSSTQSTQSVQRGNNARASERNFSLPPLSKNSASTPQPRSRAASANNARRQRETSDRDSNRGALSVGARSVRQSSRQGSTHSIRDDRMEHKSQPTHHRHASNAAPPRKKAMQDVEVNTAPVQLVACSSCGRRFCAESHQKHVRICAKVFKKRRKTFNSAKQRRPPEALQCQVQRSQGGRRQAAVGGGTRKSTSHWRQKSKEFRRCIREARAASRHIQQGKPLRDLPPARRADPDLDDRVICPHCGRRFGQQQAERHIPSCMNTRARPGGVLCGSGPSKGRSAATRPPLHRREL